MWYAIFMSLGLSVGLGMMVWALVERKKRYDAEKKAIEADELRKDAETVANNNIKAVNRLTEELSKEKELEELLYSELRKIRDVFLESGNDSVVKEWIKNELKGGKL